MSSLVKVMVILFVTALVAGCKVAVIVVEGGEVRSIGSGTCAEGTICIVEVNDTNFSESFTAVPNQGWRFVRWNKGEGFFCADSTKPTCVLSTVGTAGIEAIIASDQTFYLMPIFEPGLGTVTVDGREWAQVDRFTNLSWSDINAVCPAGACSGVLNGYDMTGWTWASVYDFNALFNFYIGADVLGPVESSYDSQDYSSAWGNSFRDDGWRSTSGGDLIVEITEGYLRDMTATSVGRQGGMFIDLHQPGDGMGPTGDAVIHFHSSFSGGWFYRAP